MSWLFGKKKSKKEEDNDEEKGLERVVLLENEKLINNSKFSIFNIFFEFIYFILFYQ